MNIEKHRKEIAQRLRSFQYERMGDGRILIGAGTGLILGGAFRHREFLGGGVEAGPAAIDPNLVVNEGLDYLLNAAFLGQTQITAFYIALFANNVNPAATWTGANFDSLANEFTAYTPSTRPEWDIGNTPTTTQSTGNTGSEALFTYSAGGPYNIYGAALLQSSVKEDTTGKLIAATKFASARLNQLAGDKLGVEYVLSAVDAG